jgi:hypothetical protein
LDETIWGAGGILTQILLVLVLVLVIEQGFEDEKNNYGARITSALAPALSPRRGRIVCRSFENLYD